MHNRPLDDRFSRLLPTGLACGVSGDAFASAADRRRERHPSAVSSLFLSSSQCNRSDTELKLQKQLLEELREVLNLYAEPE